MIATKGRELNEVLLVPQPSSVNSRDDVDLSTSIGIKIPIIASPMSGIVGVELIKELGRLGGIGILHRFYNDPILQYRDITSLAYSGVPFGVAIGLNDPASMMACDSGAKIICIDVANGYLDSVVNYVGNIAMYRALHNCDFNIMAGNVVTYEGAKRLYDAGAQMIRVGIGSGALCTTRNNTGVGYPQATAIYNCSHKMFINSTREFPVGYDVTNWMQQSNEHTDWKVIADGGIKNSGDGTKALALGADYLMMGTMFSRCFESDHNGKIEGSASREFQEQFYGEVRKSVEGVQKEAVKDISLEKMLKEFCWNMRSGFTYCNARNIDELHEKANLIVCGPESIIQK